MTTTFNTSTNLKGFNRNHRKENHFQGEYKVMTIEGDKIKEIISCRTYGTQAANYACLWVMGDSFKSGSGSASGYGYHRVSAAIQEAIQEAITNSGYILHNKDGKETSISGVGNSAIEEALLSIAEYAGYSNCQIFESHP